MWTKMPSSLSDFEVLCTIGSGSYGTCKKVKRKTDGKIFVWKEMDYGAMTESEKQMLVSEVNLLRELRHENIVKYHERVVDKKRQILYLIMEFCEGGDLAAVIKRYDRDGRHFDEETVWKTLAQCSLALSECHKRKDGKSILHRDLKPANIFLDAQKNVKLGDFGLARVLHETSFARTFVGTPYYMSPEQMNKLSYNEKSDIWSLGCVLYEMCSLMPPFLASNQRELAVKIRMGQFTRLPSRYSTELGELIGKMLNVECHARPSIESLLSSPRITKYINISSASSTASASNDMSKGLTEVLERERKCKQMEARLGEREAALKHKESQLGQLEKEVKKRLAQIEERERQLSAREEKRFSKGNSLQTRDGTIEQTKHSADKDGGNQPLTPILNRAKKIESPSKHVSFDETKNKENDERSMQIAIGMRREKEVGLFALRERERNNNEYQRRKDLRERLEKAKERATQLRTVEVEKKIKHNPFIVR